jgi:tight adherence protein C
MLSQPLFLLVVFAVTALVASVVLWQLIRTPVERRVATIGHGGVEPAAARLRGLLDWLARRLAPLARASEPHGAGEPRSPLRVRFNAAGLRSASAPAIYFGAKTVLTFLLPGLFVLALGMANAHIALAPMLALLVALAAIGYYLPNATLARLIAHRQRELFEVIPDALDLMRVCVESGLSLDASIARVGREMAFESRALSDELHLVSLELRAGASRAEALRHLALRVGLEDVDALVSILVQADRFGTSVTEALRVHSEQLRTKRRLVAEERAAKLPVKLLFPLVFCIFPALLTVLLGPAVLSIARALPRLMGGP